MKRLSLQLFTVAAICSVAGFAATTALSQDEFGASGPSSVPVELPKTASVADDLVATFAVLRRDATSRDVAPVTARKMVEGSAARSMLDPRFGTGTSYGVNDALTRRLAVVGDTTSYVVPGATGACMFTIRRDGQSLSCSPAGDIARAGIMGTQAAEAEGSRRVFGFVPDGVNAVRLTTVEGQSLDLKVRDNAFAVDVSGNPQLVHWLNRDGVELQTVPVP